VKISLDPGEKGGYSMGNVFNPDLV